MAAKLTYKFITLVTACVLSALFVKADASPFQNKADTLHPLQDRHGDPYTYPNRNSFDFQDSNFVKRTIEYDPITKQYYIIEKTGGKYYRTPTPMTMQEFLQLQGRKDEVEYFRQRANLLNKLNNRKYKPKFGFDKDWVNRITGNNKVEIRPTGYVNIAAGYQGQRIANPVLPERARKTGGPDFNMDAQFQVDASIGDKIKLPINYNTLANFNFENQLKLDYRGKSDEILKQFQMGTINFTSKGTLIPGAQSLFGIKTQLQFGRLFITTALATQNSTRQNLGIQGGAASQSFNIRADEYEENRHFLMAQYFKNNYNKAMGQLPIVRSNVQIVRLEVWVTNKTSVTTNVRDVVGFMDLGETNPYNANWLKPGADSLPDNNSNTLYQTVVNMPGARNASQVQYALSGLNGMQPVQDFEKTYARKLQPTDYYFNPQIGFLSLNQPLQPDEVLAVAYQYTYNGKVRQVGEFSQDVPPDSSGNSTKVLFLKLLKATSQRTNLPIWNLMMKNVYSVGYGQLERTDFQLDVYYEEPSTGTKKYLPIAVTNTPPVQQGTPILQLVNLDRLNKTNDPQPDGVFDYLEGFTVISSQSRIIFPVLEPFGRDLEYAVKPADRASYIYYPLYDTIKSIAQNYTNLDRYRLIGRSKSTSNTDYQLGFNIPRGSVTVTAGGQILRENIDYEINYDLGTLRIINSAIINSGIPVQIQYENNATYGLQQKNFIGLRMDYLASRHLSLGATMVQLSERPFFTKQAYGEDPIRNRMYGVDVDYRNDVPRLTKWLDKLPFYSTKTMSSITAYGEAAYLDPGHAKQIGSGSQGAVYVDDFEGTRSSIDLRFPLISWTLASVPQHNAAFPEGDLINNLSSGYSRGKIAWYNIEQQLQERKNTDNPIKNLSELTKPETRLVYQSEIFPKRTTDIGQAVLNTFDIAFYPKERGPYNFVTDPSKMDANGRLLNPQKTWGGLMRNIDQTDFESSNIEFIEFWVQDPFLNTRNPQGGEMNIDLGNISEDVLRDGKRLYENGLPTPGNPNIPVDTSVWGRIPRNPIQVTNAFSNDPNDRPYQDVGLDGLTDTDEKTHFSGYLNQLATVYGINSPVYQKAIQDPADDNFKGYRDPSFTSNDGILSRYKNFNNPQGNSPVAKAGDQYVNASTLYPDQEELNRDNTMNENEEYFHYKVDMFPGMDISNNSYITDVRRIQANLQDGTRRAETWYLFRVPIKAFQSKIGNIPDFKSIRFIRMFLTGFTDSVVLRFAKMELVRNQWRKFTNVTDTSGNVAPLPANDPTKLDVLAVNIEENDQRSPIPYRQPPGVARQQQLSNNNVQLLLNEQSLSIKALGLNKMNTRGVFKTMNLDLRSYGRLSMFIHAESSTVSNDIADGDMNAVIRIGSDFTNNYYEIRIPLKITLWGAKDSLSIWPAQNNLDFDLTELTNLKIRRNSSGVSVSSYYAETASDGRRYAIFGNPNLGEVRGMFMGVENVKKEIVNTEIWYDELRLTKLNEQGGWAALGRVDLKLADLGMVTLSGSYRSVGFGTLDQRVNERSKNDYIQYDATTNLDLGKLVPKKAAVQIPVYASVSKTISKPLYDPFDLDLRLNDKLRYAKTQREADSIRTQAIDQTTIKTINFTNVKKNRTNGKKPQPWDISNIDLNYNFVHQQRSNPVIEMEDIKKTRAAIGYNYAPVPKFVEPFKRLIKSRSPWFALVRDFNFNYKPSVVSIKADVFRQFGATRSRNVGTPFQLPATFDKFFYFDRYYNLRWDFTRSLSFDFNAINNAKVDEPYGYIDTKQKVDSVKNNFRSGGRTTHYHHDFTLSYNLPTSKLPILDWTTLRASYTAKYDWYVGTLLDRNLGNTLQNGQTRNLTGELDFERLYQKWKFLRSVYSDIPNQQKSLQQNPKDTSAKRKRVRDPNQLLTVGAVPKAFAKIVTSLKRISVQYTEDMGTLLPGYMDSTQALGMNLRSSNPGWKYILGYQPDTSAINMLGAKGLLSRSQLFNQLIQQRYTQRITVTAQVSPLRDLNVDITFDRTFDKNYSELYKDTTGTSGLARLNPYAAGSFSMSYISYQTLFTKFDPNQLSATFQKFQANRTFLSNRLGKSNPYAQGNYNSSTGFYDGYGRYAQDVLIPAFLAAYTNKDPNSIQLIKNSNPNLRSNPFSSLLPRPNWNIVYNGLTRIQGLEKIFTNITLRHGYNSRLSMNSFTTALLFQDIYHAGYPSFIDTSTKNYVPYFLVPNVTISEQFAPLLGIDMTLANQMGLNFDYKKSRTLSLSLVDYQLAENRSTEYNIGANWRRKGMPIFRNVRIGKNGKKLDNDVTFQFSYSFRDDATSNSKLDQNNAFGTAGQKVIGIHPKIQYVVNNRVQLTFYYDKDKVIPKIATSAPITTIRAGVQVRISLAQ